MIRVRNAEFGMRHDTPVRADVCASDDHETVARLQEAIAALGGVADDTWHDSPLGTGLTKFRFGERGVSVFIDAWLVDVAGPEDLVNEILAAIRG